MVATDITREFERVVSQLGPIVIWAQFQKTTGPPGPSRGWAQMIFWFNMEAQLGPRGPVEVGPTRRHVLLVTPRMDPPRLGQTMTGPVRASTGPDRFHHDWARAQSRLGSSGLQPSGPDSKRPGSRWWAQSSFEIGPRCLSGPVEILPYFIRPNIRGLPLCSKSPGGLQLR